MERRELVQAIRKQFVGKPVGRGNEYDLGPLNAPGPEYNLLQQQGLLTPGQEYVRAKIENYEATSFDPYDRG